MGGATRLHMMGIQLSSCTLAVPRQRVCASRLQTGRCSHRLICVCQLSASLTPLAALPCLNDVNCQCMHHHHAFIFICIHMYVQMCRCADVHLSIQHMHRPN